MRERITLLDVPVDALTLHDLMGQVSRWLEQPSGRHTISYVNVHVLDRTADNPALRRFLNQVDLCYCDGKGIVLAARLLGHDLPQRMTGADWIWDLAALAEGRWRIYWLGGEPGSTAAAAARLRAVHPDLVIRPDHGYHPESGPGRDALIQRINAWRADILLVGMGTPVQERWVQANRADLDTPIVWCLGATADFISGRVSRGPAWLHDNQEWLARLMVDPRRLWRRYLLGNGRVFARVLKARLGA